jgi:hypothetical protein
MVFLDRFSTLPMVVASAKGVCVMAKWGYEPLEFWTKEVILTALPDVFDRYLSSRPNYLRDERLEVLRAWAEKQDLRQLQCVLLNDDYRDGMFRFDPEQFENIIALYDPKVWKRFCVGPCAGPAEDKPQINDYVDAWYRADRRAEQQTQPQRKRRKKGG